MGDDLPTVDLGTGRTAVAIAAGNEHTCALLGNGALKCWGNGTFGRLGLGNTSTRGDGAGEMGDALPVVGWSRARCSPSGSRAASKNSDTDAPTG